LRERRELVKLSKDLSRSGREKVDSASEFSPFIPHTESMRWIWQVRTGMVILVLGSFHIILLGVDVLTPLFGERLGIEAVTSVERVRAGLWLPYAILLLCVEFHASVGLYRLAVKWGAGLRMSRSTMHRIEQAMLWFFLVLGFVVLLVLADVLPPPLAFLLGGSG
jgi:fumarate reductase subunit C